MDIGQQKRGHQSNKKCFTGSISDKKWPALISKDHVITSLELNDYGNRWNELTI